jgi:hypothetical protein
MMEVKELKKMYEELGKKFKLPSFKELDENFEIFKIDRESDALLRAVRKQMMEKIVNSVGFVEMLLNPANAPRMYFSYLRAMSAEDKKTLEGIYSAFSDLVILSLQAEIEYDEKTEVELIKKINQVWKDNSPGFLKILKNIVKPNENNNTGLSKKEKNYFG